jgi:hypothetical protein
VLTLKQYGFFVAISVFFGGAFEVANWGKLNFFNIPPLIAYRSRNRPFSGFRTGVNRRGGLIMTRDISVDRCLFEFHHRSGRGLGPVMI